MKIRIKTPHLLVLALVCLGNPIQSVAAGAYDCRVYEYAELKDMDTSGLLSNASMYQHTAQFLRKSVSLTEQYGYHQLGPQVARDEKEALDRCREETLRIVSLLKKRKNLQSTIKTYQPPFYSEFADAFNLPKVK